MTWYTPILDSIKEIQISDDIKNVLTALLYGIMGFLSSFFIEWFKKRRNPKEVQVEFSNKLVSSAKENVEIAQNVIDLLDERLRSERDYYDSKINESKTDCEDQIIRLKENYDKALFEVEKKNDAEKKVLSDKISKLELDKEDLQKQVTELTDRLKKYENGIKSE